jgi:ribosome modulation factor
MNNWNAERFNRAMDEGTACWHDDMPLDVCPYGPPLRIPEDGVSDEHEGWLFGWWGEELRERELSAYDDGYVAAVEDSTAPCPYSSHRMCSAWAEGWIRGMVDDSINYIRLH